VHNLQNNNGYVANTIIFRFSKHRGTVLYRFCWISRTRSWERSQNVYTSNRTCIRGLAILQFSKKL